MLVLLVMQPSALLLEFDTMPRFQQKCKNIRFVTIFKNHIGGGGVAEDVLVLRQILISTMQILISAIHNAGTRITTKT